MSDDNQNADDRPAENIKSEFDRKLQNQSAKIDQIMDALTNMQSQRQQAAAPQDSGPSLEDLKFTDPERYEQLKEQQLEQKLESKVMGKIEQENRKQQTLVDLINKYPDLKSDQSELSIAAKTAHEALPENLRGTAEGYKLAVLEAASQAKKGESKVSDKKSEDVGEFIAGSGSGEGRGESKKKKADLDPKVETIAELMGLDVSDEKVRARLKDRAGRSNWSQYKGEKK